MPSQIAPTLARAVVEREMMKKTRSMSTALLSTHAKKSWKAWMIAPEYLETVTMHRAAPSRTVRAEAAA